MIWLEIKAWREMGKDLKGETMKRSGICEFGIAEYDKESLCGEENSV